MGGGWREHCDAARGTYRYEFPDRHRMLSTGPLTQALMSNVYFLQMTLITCPSDFLGMTQEVS